MAGLLTPGRHLPAASTAEAPARCLPACREGPEHPTREYGRWGKWGHWFRRMHIR